MTQPASARPRRPKAKPLGRDWNRIALYIFIAVGLGLVSMLRFRQLGPREPRTVAEQRALLAHTDECLVRQRDGSPVGAIDQVLPPRPGAAERYRVELLREKQIVVMEGEGLRRVKCASLAH